MCCCCYDCYRFQHSYTVIASLPLTLAAVQLTDFLINNNNNNRAMLILHKYDDAERLLRDGVLELVGPYIEALIEIAHAFAGQVSEHFNMLPLNLLNWSQTSQLQQQ
jgi:hypothetical protein